MLISVSDGLGAGSVTTVTGLNISESTDSFTVTNEYALTLGGNYVNGVGMVTNNYGIYISGPYADTADRIVNNYGLYITDQSFGSTNIHNSYKYLLPWEFLHELFCRQCRHRHI